MDKQAIDTAATEAYTTMLLYLDNRKHALTIWRLHTRCLKKNAPGLNLDTQSALKKQCAYWAVQFYWHLNRSDE